MLMKVDNHEYFRCFTLNIMHLSWPVFLNSLPILKELLTLFQKKHLITKIQFKSIHKKNPPKRSFSCYQLEHYRQQLFIQLSLIVQLLLGAFLLPKKSVKYFLLFLFGLIFCHLLFFGKNQLPDYLHLSIQFSFVYTLIIPNFQINLITLH